MTEISIKYILPNNRMFGLFFKVSSNWFKVNYG